MSNICAGIGRGQMEILQKRVYQRRNNFDFYKKSFEGIEEISLMSEPDEKYYSNRWLSTILIENPEISPETIRVTLEADNIECRPLWKPMHLQPVFAHAPFYGNGTSDRLFEKGLCLPSGSNLTESDLNRVVEKVKSGIKIGLGTTKKFYAGPVLQ